MGISDISLASGMRASLLSLTGTNAKIDRTQERLATGKKVNSALDNPTNFFAAVAHQHRASDLNSHKDGIKEAIQVIKTADIGMNAMTSIFRQAAAIADSAKGAASLNELSQLADQFNEMRKQVDLLAADSDYRGTNLLLRQDLNIDLGNNNTLTIQGADVTSSGFDNMTNGLNVETASMDPLNIVDPNYVTSSDGSIKQDGQLTIINNNVPEIDAWLGNIGIKNQIITSQDVAFTTNTSLSDGSIVQSQLLDNIGVAEYGTGLFAVYRDTTVSAAVTAGSGSVVSTTILPSQTTDVSSFLGPLLSDGSKPFTLERDLTASTGIVDGTASITSTTVISSTGVAAFLGPLAGSGTKSVELYREITANAVVAGDPAAVDTTDILNKAAVADFLGGLAGSGSQTLQLYRDIATNAAVIGDPTAVSSTSILDNSALADFLGTIEGAGTSSFSLFRNVSLSSVVNSATGDVSLDMNNAPDIAAFIGSQADGGNKPFTLTYTATPPTWTSSDVNSVTGIGGPPPTAVAIDLAGNGTSITANLIGSWSDGDSITITTTAGPWQSDNPAVAVTVSGTELNLDLNNSGTTDIKITLASLQSADAVIGVDAATSAWKSDNPVVGVSVSGTGMNLDLDNNGSDDIKISLASFQRADAVIGVDTAASNWIADNPAVTVTADGSTLSLNLDGNATTDMKVNLDALTKADTRLSTNVFLSEWHSTAFPAITISPAGNTLDINLKTDVADLTSDIQLTLSTLLYGDAQLTVTPESSIWKTSDPTISLNQPTGSGAMTADLNGDGINDIQIDLPTGGPNGAAWLSTERVQAATTGPFSTTDSSVVLKYDDDMKTVGLILAGGGGGIDITINLEDSWAVNNLPTSPLGNGDSINLTVDGRHRWVKGDGVTPNASGISLSTSEIDDAINTMRIYSVQNSSSLKILTVRDDFIGDLVNVLETGADNLTLADMNEEGAQMLMLQTRQNLGFTSLSLGSQAAQSVMRLF